MEQDFIKNAEYLERINEQAELTVDDFLDNYDTSQITRTIIEGAIRDGLSKVYSYLTKDVNLKVIDEVHYGRRGDLTQVKYTYQGCTESIVTNYLFIRVYINAKDFVSLEEMKDLDRNFFIKGMTKLFVQLTLPYEDYIKTMVVAEEGMVNAIFNTLASVQKYSPSIRKRFIPWLIRKNFSRPLAGFNEDVLFRNLVEGDIEKQELSFEKIQAHRDYNYVVSYESSIHVLPFSFFEGLGIPTKKVEDFIRERLIDPFSEKKSIIKDLEKNFLRDNLEKSKEPSVYANEPNNKYYAVDLNLDGKQRHSSTYSTYDTEIFINSGIETYIPNDLVMSNDKIDILTSDVDAIDFEKTLVLLDKLNHLIGERTENSVTHSSLLFNPDAREIIQQSLIEDLISRIHDK